MPPKRKPTAKQKGFVADFMKTKNATKAALNNYDTTDINTAASIGCENLTKPKIVKMIDNAMELAQDSIIYLAGNAKNENVKLNASKDILDRGGLKPKDELDVTSDGKSLGVVILPEKDIKQEG